MFSPRLALPAKPKPYLALLLGRQNWRVLFSIRKSPVRDRRRARAAVVFCAAALGRGARGRRAVLLVEPTGPFSVLFAPLFAWRWWRERHADNLAALLVVAACGAAQGWLVLHGPTVAAVAGESFHPAKFLEIAGSRLVAWRSQATRMARAPHATGRGRGVGRSSSRRSFISRSVATFTARGARTGRDRAGAPARRGGVPRAGRTQEQRISTPVSGIFICRACCCEWLVAWEFDAASRTVRWLARERVVLGLISFVPGYVLPAPPDLSLGGALREPIRRGVPAKIPTLPEGWVLDYPGRPPGR